MKKGMKTRTIKMKKTDTAYSLFQECKKLFPAWCWDEKELKNITNDRNGKYEIKFKDCVEADEELKNTSANELKEKGIIGITLPERLKMELDFFKETGKHLDVENITLCSGSRLSDGFVPFVYWFVGGLRVHYFSPGIANGRLRSRQAVSSTSNLKSFNLDSFDLSQIKITIRGKNYGLVEEV